MALRPKRSGQFPLGTADDFEPSSAADSERAFPDEPACRRFLARLRWPRGFRCPHCEQVGQIELSERGLVRCPVCSLTSSPTTGTLLDGSPFSLRAWFHVVWEIISRESGADPEAIGLALGLADVEMVKSPLDLLKSAYRQVWQDPLRGFVEVAKIPVELGAPWSDERGGTRNPVVAIAVEVHNEGLGRVRVERLPQIDPPTMQAFVRAAVAPGSCIRTGNWDGYVRLRTAGYGHLVRFAPDDHEEAGMRHALQVASILRLWLWGTGARTADRLDYYLDEFVFRYDARLRWRTGDRGALFRELVRLLVLPADKKHARGAVAG
jgi:ISXO2 transposase-like protein/transposase-like zinc ribbon protein